MIINIDVCIYIFCFKNCYHGFQQIIISRNNLFYSHKFYEFDLRSGTTKAHTNCMLWKIPDVDRTENLKKINK